MALVSVAGNETHRTTYFDNNKLWGFLDANPGLFSAGQVLEFFNYASLNEAGSWVTSTIGGTEVKFIRRKFGKVFDLDYNFQMELPENIGEETAKAMLRRKKKDGLNVDEWKKGMNNRSRTDFNNAYSHLAWILIRDVEGRKGGLNYLSWERLTLMHKFHTGERVDWCSLILSKLVEYINEFKWKENEKGLLEPKHAVGYGSEKSSESDKSSESHSSDRSERAEMPSPRVNSPMVNSPVNAESFDEEAESPVQEKSPEKEKTPEKENSPVPEQNSTEEQMPVENPNT